MQLCSTWSTAGAEHLAATLQMYRAVQRRAWCGMAGCSVCWTALTARSCRLGDLWLSRCAGKMELCTLSVAGSAGFSCSWQLCRSSYLHSTLKHCGVTNQPSRCMKLKSLDRRPRQRVWWESSSEGFPFLSWICCAAWITWGSEHLNSILATVSKEVHDRRKGLGRRVMAMTGNCCYVWASLIPSAVPSWCLDDILSKSVCDRKTDVNSLMRLMEARLKSWPIFTDLAICHVKSKGLSLSLWVCGYYLAPFFGVVQ